MTPDLDTARAFIEASRWQFAWSMRFLPHSYTLREWHEAAGTVTAFEGMIRLIREQGYVENFGKRRQLTYLRIDGWRYWSMGKPTEPLTPEWMAERLVVNRCQVDERGRPSKGPRWLREGVKPAPEAAQMRLEGLR
jgi:hypothetical protein